MEEQIGEQRQTAPHDSTLYIESCPPQDFPELGPETFTSATRISARVIDPNRTNAQPFLVRNNILVPHEDGGGGGGSSGSGMGKYGGGGGGHGGGGDGTTGTITRRRAFWLQRNIRDAIYGRVWSGLILQSTITTTTSSSETAAAGGAAWEITTERVAIKELDWTRIRENRTRLVENPINEVRALRYLMDYHEREVQQQQQAAAGGTAAAVVDEDDTNIIASSENVLLPMALLTDQQSMYIVMPYCDGDLFDLLENEQKFDEHEARRLFREILKGLGHLQRVGICHRDISLENLMIRTNNDDDRTTTVVVIDMGMALRIRLDNDENDDGSGGTTDDGRRHRYRIDAQTTCGKWKYISPEILRSRFPFDGYAVDLWAAGIILFLLLTGFHPWDRASDTDPRFKFMSRGGMSEIAQHWNLGLSEEAVDLLQRMLYKDPLRRLTLRQIWQHPWMQMPDEDEAGDGGGGGGDGGGGDDGESPTPMEIS